MDKIWSKKRKAKVSCYFSLISTLKRIYASSKIISSIRWHDEGHTKDRMLRYPTDSLAWKAFDDKYPDFASDIRNFMLATDGFNLFQILSSIYSTWPVILISYNLPRCMCMK